MLIACVVLSESQVRDGRYQEAEASVQRNYLNSQYLILATLTTSVFLLSVNQ